jgi:hypothetical protein
MFRRLIQAFTHPLAGPLGFGVSLVLCAMLVSTALTAAHTETQLRARIAQLSAQDARTGALLHAKLAACEGALPAEGPAAPGGPTTVASVASRAARLAGHEPQGFDVCARMESADRAVLETLR